MGIILSSLWGSQQSEVENVEQNERMDCSEIEVRTTNEKEEEIQRRLDEHKIRLLHLDARLHLVKLQLLKKQSPMQPSRRSEGIRCYRCGLKGHVRRLCPQKSQTRPQKPPRLSSRPNQRQEQCQQSHTRMLDLQWPWNGQQLSDIVQTTQKTTIPTIVNNPSPTQLVMYLQ